MNSSISSCAALEKTNLLSDAPGFSNEFQLGPKMSPFLFILICKADGSLKSFVIGRHLSCLTVILLWQDHAIIKQLVYLNRRPRVKSRGGETWTTTLTTNIGTIVACQLKLC